MSKKEEPVTFTQEEIDYAERSLKAEITKLERAIERKKKEIEDLQPKGFFAKSNKSKIMDAEDELVKLEDELTDLQALTGVDYLRHKMRKKSSFEGLTINKKTIAKIGDVVEIAGNIPVPGAGIAKGIGKALKSYGKKR